MGIAITGNGKIIYPPAFTNRISLFNAFVQKHNSYIAGENPLLPYLTEQNILLINDSNFAGQAIANYNNFTNVALQSENETELGNQLWSPVKHIRSINGFFLKLYGNNPKALGAWGFVVNDSVRTPKLRTTKL